MEFTPEQEREIRASYKDAKNPEKQIGILADLYVCKKEDIIEVLRMESASKKAKEPLNSYDQAAKDSAVKAVILEGMTHREAAEKYGVPFSNMTKWVQRARKKQAEFLDHDFEQTSTSVKGDNTPKKPRKISLPVPPASELQEGLDGLGVFVTTFRRLDFITKDELNCLSRVLLKAEGFVSGVKAASR